MAEYQYALMPTTGVSFRNWKDGKELFLIDPSRVFFEGSVSGSGWNNYGTGYYTEGSIYHNWMALTIEGGYSCEYKSDYPISTLWRVVCSNGYESQVKVRSSSTGRKIISHEYYDAQGYSVGRLWMSGYGGSEEFVTFTFEREKESYTVSFKHGAYGTGTEQTRTVLEDDIPVTPGAIFTRIGYNQDGWQTPDGAKRYGLNENIDAVTGNVTLYPHWALKPEVRVIFDANGGQKPSETMRSIREGQAFGSLPTVARNDYKFLGWFTAATGGTKVTETSVYLETWGKRLYAQWSKNGIVVTFNAQGGTVSPETMNAVTGKTYGTLPTAMRNRDEVFNGWYTAATGGTKITANSIVGAAAITLYAQYVAKEMTYTIVFNDPTGNNASVAKAFKIGVAERFPGFGSGLGWRLPDGYAYSQAETWRRYDVDKIYPDGQMANNLAREDEEIQLYLITTRKVYTLTLNPNGGSVSQTKLEIEHGRELGRLPTPTKGTEHFLGWFTAATGGTEYSPTNKMTANLTLYAHWGEKKIGWIEIVTT